jgi:hypothetical protein
LTKLSAALLADIHHQPQRLRLAMISHHLVVSFASIPTDRRELRQCGIRHIHPLAQRRLLATYHAKIQRDLACVLGGGERLGGAIVCVEVAWPDTEGHVGLRCTWAWMCQQEEQRERVKGGGGGSRSSKCRSNPLTCPLHSNTVPKFVIVVALYPTPDELAVAVIFLPNPALMAGMVASQTGQLVMLRWLPWAPMTGTRLATSSPSSPACHHEAPAVAAAAAAAATVRLQSANVRWRQTGKGDSQISTASVPNAMPDILWGVSFRSTTSLLSPFLLVYASSNLMKAGDMQRPLQAHV